MRKSTGKLRKKIHGKLHRAAALSLVCALGFGLTACGGEESRSAYATGTPGKTEEIVVETAVEEDLLFFTEEFDIALKDATCVKVHGDSIYYGSERVVMRYPLSGEAMSFQSLSWEDAPGIWNLRQITFGEEGSIYALASVNVSLNPVNVPDYRTYACKFDGEGKLVYAYEMTEDLERLELGKWSSAWEIEADKEGRLYVMGSNFIWILQPDGSSKDSLTFETEVVFELLDLVKGEDGRVYISYKGGYSVKYYIGEIETFFATGDYENGAAHQEKVEILGVESCGDGAFLVYDKNAAYRYDLEAGTMTLMCKWQDIGIEGNHLQYVAQDADGRLLAVVRNAVNGGDVYIAEGMTEAEALERGLLSNKTDITIAVYGTHYKQDLLSAVASFNRSSELYNVIIQDYSENFKDSETAKKRINNELVSGKGADILGMGDFEEYAMKGAIENLYEYLEKSDALSKEDFFAKILEGYTVDGVLTAIPREFTVSTLVGNPDIVGEEMGWTLDEMMALAKQYPEKTVMGDGTESKGFVLSRFMRFYGAQFLDWENMTCDFHSEDFKQILRLVEAYPDEIVPYVMGAPSSYTLLETGESLVADVSIDDFWTIQPYVEACGGKLTYVGYPAPEGVGCNLTVSDALAINSNSKCKEGAWAFMEYFLQYDNSGSPLQLSGFPSNITLFEKLLEEAMTFSRSSAMHAGDGWRYAYHATTEEEADAFRAFLENMEFTVPESEVCDIILEEAGSYYSGQKSMDDVIEVIQNRVQNYMDENR